MYEKDDVAILVGGSGLYIDALINGFDELPEVDKEIRRELNEQFSKEGFKNLLMELSSKDISYFNKVDKNNPIRVIRALEVIRSTGRPYSSFANKSTAKIIPYSVKKIALDMPREELYNRINHRVDTMIIKGWEEEAKTVFPFRNLNALRTVGYKEWFDYFQEKTTYEKTIELIKQHTRNYAKRQLTWFRKDTSYIWYNPNQINQIISSLP